MFGGIHDSYIENEMEEENGNRKEEEKKRPLLIMECYVII
jgi:hypothetical protein